MWVPKLHRKTRLSGSLERYRSAGLITWPLDVKEQRDAINSSTEIIRLISIIHPDSQTCRLKLYGELQRCCRGTGAAAERGVQTQKHLIPRATQINQTANPCWEFTNEDVDSEFLPVTVGKVLRWSSSGVSSTLGQSYWHMM